MNTGKNLYRYLRQKNRRIMEKDRFTKNNTVKIDDGASFDDFKIDLSTDTVFTKNPISSTFENEDKPPKKGWFDKVYELVETFIDQNSENSAIAKRLKIILKSFKIKDTLGRLNKINESVDELVSLKVPFGEQNKRYEILANRLIRANHLHTQIQKELS